MQTPLPDERTPDSASAESGERSDTGETREARQAGDRDEAGSDSRYKRRIDCSASSPIPWWSDGRYR